MKLKQLAVGIIAGLSIMPAIATPTFAATNTTKTITIEGTKVSVPTTGGKWVKVKGYMHYVKDGKLVKGWKHFTKADGESTPHYSFFDKTNGRLYVGWHTMGSAEGEKTKHMSYFGDNGWMRTGWQSMGKGTGNSYNENSTKHYSYFGDNGWLRTGWQSMGKGTGNSFNENSTKHYSYFGDNGWLRTGWQEMGKGTGNSFNENSSKHWSYFGGNGWLFTKTGEHLEGGKYFSNNSSGWATLYEGRKDWGNNHYYFKNGVKANPNGNLYNTLGRKTIIIGDSRTVDSYKSAGGKAEFEVTTKTGNEVWIAKYSMGYDWFINTAIPTAERYGIDKNTDVVIFLGVNDIKNTNNAKKYMNTLNTKGKEWVNKGARVYYVSLGDATNKDGFNPSQNIKEWNNYMKNSLKNHPVKYIDMYNNVSLKNGLRDGLHYNPSTCRLFVNWPLTHRY